MVGAQITELLARRYEMQPVVLDLCFQWDYLDTIVERDQFVAVDGSILDRALIEDLIREYEITDILHTAAVLPMRVGHDPHPGFYKVNTWGTANLLFTARDSGVDRFLMFSTNGVYQFREHGVNGPVTEDYPSGLIEHDSYGSSKATAESLLKELTAAGDIEGRIVRPGEIFGPVMSREGDDPIYWKAMIDAAIEGEPFVLESHPEHRLDWVYAEDVAEVAVRALIEDSSHIAYHAAREACVGIYDMKDVLDRIFPTNNVSLEDCGSGGWEYPLSMERVREDLEYEPQFDLEAGIRAYKDWYIKR
jgi:nucleoside-diphosphate-sugar epimerase